MLFKTGITDFLLLNTKEDILTNVFSHIGKAVQKQEFMDKINTFFKISSFVFHRIKKVIQVSTDMKASTDQVQIFE